MRLLAEHLKLFTGVHVLPFTGEAATRYRDFRKQKIRVGSMDLKIGAIVIGHDATLWTRNVKHFGQIPGLKVEDWTKLSRGPRS